MDVIVLDGPTGAGKSLLLRFIGGTNFDGISAIRKLTTREKRAVSDDDHIFVDSIPDSPEYLKYADVGSLYAVDLKEISALLSEGIVPALVCSDMVAINALRERYEVKTIFVYRPMSSQAVRDLMALRGVSTAGKVEDRLNELATLPKRYTERILLYDHVLLNIGSVEDLEAQLERVLALA